MTIKLITFDLDNTLWHTDPVIVRAEQTLWSWIQTQYPHVAEQFTLDSLQALKAEVANQQPQLRHKLSQLRLAFLSQLFQRCGYTQKEAEILAQQGFVEFIKARNDVELFPEALNMLQILQQDYQIIALSNGNADLKAIGIDHFFEAHFHAENVPQPKPHKDMFIAALQHTGVSVEECIHIGDHPEQDIHAAKRLGIHTIWANVLNASWPASIPPADHEILHLNQLPALVKRY